MTIDRSEGRDSMAEQFMLARSDIGATLVRTWAREHLSPSSSIVDVGYGWGVPIARALIENGFTVFGIDASPLLLAAFGHRFPTMRTACEAAQDSAFFRRAFAGAAAVGLLYLLQAEDQYGVLRRVAHALQPGGRFLFSAPREACEWRDMLTGRPSRSLGRQAYERQLQACGLRLVGCHLDESGNHYFGAAWPAARRARRPPSFRSSRCRCTGV